MEPGQAPATLRKREKFLLHYRGHELDPEDFLRFVELDEFADEWRELGLIDDNLRA